jgi:hypothetical protein
MVSLTIEAKEKRKVATADAEGAYLLHANMDEWWIIWYKQTPKNTDHTYTLQRKERSCSTPNC